MSTFALITEGITDQIVLETLLMAQFGSQIDVNPIQPLRDATDAHRQANFAGWEKVIEACTAERFDEILSVNDFIVVQIDTDQCEHKNFGIALSVNGAERAVPDIVQDVQMKLMQALDPQRYQGRILFAISVHSLECWLLPLHAKTDADTVSTKNCTDRLERSLKKAGQDYKKDARCYQGLAKPFAKPEKLAYCREKNQSLALFLDSCERVREQSM
jgi:hypothetical protein